MMAGADLEWRDCVLVLAPTGRDAAIITRLLTDAGFPAEPCADFGELTGRLNQACVAVLAEEALRDPVGRTQIDSWIKDQPPWSDFPFIVLTARAGTVAAQDRSRADAETLGNITLLERPLHPVTLTSAVRAAIRARERQRAAARVLEQREAAERALRQSEARYRNLAEALPQLVWTCLPDGRCDYLSRQWLEYTGTPEGEQLDLRWLDKVIHPDDRARTYEHWHGAVAGLNDYDIEYRIRRHDGVFRWFKTRGTPVRDEDNRIAHWFGTSTDIQDIVEARETLARSRAELEQLVEARTRERDRIFELSQDLFAVAGYDGFLKVVNPAWETVLGRSREELLSRPFSNIVHPDDHVAAGRIIAALQSGETLQRFEDRLIRSDGSVIWVSWTAVPGDQVFYAVGRDVTADRESRLALMDANERLSAEMAERRRAEEALLQAQRMEAVGQLTGGVAHDFNNLLTVISGGLALLERDPDEKRRQRLMDGMRQAVARGAGLTGQLLAFSRRQTLRPEAVDVAAQVSGMSELLERSLREDIEVRMEFPTDLWPVEADPAQLELVVLNLAVNARDAMPNGGTLAVVAENVPGFRDGADLSGDFVRLSVTDTGTGMDTDVLARIFEPFFTTKEVGQGTGLGLAQVYGFARQSGGTVEVESKPGRGTKVMLLLPRSRRSPAQAPSGSVDFPTNTNARNRSVLLVEDDENVAALAADMVEQLGYQVTRVATAAAALGALADGRSIDVVFSDIMMPGHMNGLDLAREIRRRRPELPVVLTTGYNAAPGADIREGIPLLRKPYALDQLARALHVAVQSGKPADVRLDP
jgi:PAS domain S-box-containing protein